jgi:hypothetical protein
MLKCCYLDLKRVGMMHSKCPCGMGYIYGIYGDLKSPEHGEDTS